MPPTTVSTIDLPSGHQKSRLCTRRTVIRAQMWSVRCPPISQAAPTSALMAGTAHDNRNRKGSALSHLRVGSPSPKSGGRAPVPGRPAALPLAPADVASPCMVCRRAVAVRRALSTVWENVGWAHEQPHPIFVGMQSSQRQAVCWGPAGSSRAACNNSRDQTEPPFGGNTRTTTTAAGRPYGAFAMTTFVPIPSRFVFRTGFQA